VYQEEIEIFLERKKTYVVTQLTLFSKGSLFVSLIGTNQSLSKCSLTIDINTYFRTDHLLKNNIFTSAKNMDWYKIPLLDTLEYFVFWVTSKINAREAKNVCTSLEAKLVSPCTLYELSLLQYIVLGLKFNQESYSHASPIRMYPYWGVFIDAEALKLCKVYLIVKIIPTLNSRC